MKGRAFTCGYYCEKLGAKMAVGGEAAGVGVLVLEVSACDALLSTQEVRVLQRRAESFG